MWLFPVLQSRTVKCPFPAPESPPVHRTKRGSENKFSCPSAASAMKSEGMGTANKRGDSQSSKAKNLKKADQSIALKAKSASAGTPVVNGTASSGARGDIASASGPRSANGDKDQEKKSNPGARPKTSPLNCTSATVTRAPKRSAGKADSTAVTMQAQPIATSTSDSVSPKNGAISPRNDNLAVPGSCSLLTFVHFIIPTVTN